MRILIIGGTRFVGRYVTEAALARGHEVTLLHRGRTGGDLFPDAEHLLADRNDDAALVAALDGRSFDATVDVCAYVPRHVTTLAGALGGRGGHHIFVSTISVYADPDAPGADESSPLVEPADKQIEEVTDETYGGLKVECERAVTAAYPRLAIIRPTYVVGPADPLERWTRWIDRIGRGGDVLAPGPREAPMQMVDVRDQGIFVVELVEHQTTGVFNSIGADLPATLGDLLDAIVTTIGPEGTRLVWVDGDWLSEREIRFEHLPLWSEGQMEYALAMSNAAARKAGMPSRPIEQTIRDTAAWIDSVESPYKTEPPLTAEHEASLLAAWNAR